MAKFDIKINGHNAVINGLQKLIPSPEARKEMLFEMGTVQKDNIKEAVLKHQVDIHGNPFKPSKRALREHGQTLVDTGHMIGAVNIVKLNSESVTVGLGAPMENKKAFWHQYGTRRGLPARPWFGFRPGDVEKLMEVLKKHFNMRLQAFKREVK